MPFCPASDCPPRRLTGRAAEYRAGVTRCADCGAVLVAYDPTPPLEERLPLAGPAAVRRRLLTTAGVCLALVAAAFLPNPLLDNQALGDLLAGGGLGLGLGGGLWLTGRLTGPLALGVGPLLTGFVLVELTALVVPALRRRRLADLGLRKRLWIAALVAGSGLAFIQGVSQAIWLESWGGSQPLPVVGHPGWAFRLTCGLLMAAGSGAFALGARVIDRRGLGRGFAVMVLLDAALGLPVALTRGSSLVRAGAVSPGELVLLAGLLVAFAVGLGWFWRQGDRPLGRAPLRLPTCGLAPVELAVLVAWLPAVLASFFWAPWLQRIQGLLTPGSESLLAIQIGLVALGVVPFSNWFYWRRRRTLRSEEQRAAWRSARLHSGLFLAALAGTDFVAGRWLAGGAGLWPGSLALVIVLALAADWWQELSVRRRAAAGEDLQIVERHQDVADALVAARLYAREPPELAPVVLGLRFRSLTYFFAPYVPLVLLGPPGLKPRAHFTGGEQPEPDELAREFD